MSPNKRASNHRRRPGIATRRISCRRSDSVEDSSQGSPHDPGVEDARLQGRHDPSTVCDQEYRPRGLCDGGSVRADHGEMKRPKLESSPVPDQVIDVLKNNKIGYLSVLSKSEELYSYPVAFHFSGSKLYFMTPVSAAKFKILKNNPTVSFIVDNGKDHGSLRSHDPGQGKIGRAHV